MTARRANSARHYIRAARVFTATTSPVIEDGVVEVVGSKIVGVAPWENVKDALASESVEDFGDATALPGLIDAHAHLTLAADGRGYEEMARDSDEMMALVSLRNLRLHLECGVTTLRDNGGRNRVTFVVREAIARGYFAAPRLLLSGRPITHSLGHFHWCNGVADGSDAIRAEVRKLVAEGADHIKIMASGGATAGSLPWYPSYTAAELRVAVDTAHELGRLTAAHCRATSSMVNALDASVDCLEHAGFLVPPSREDRSASDPLYLVSSVTKYDRGVAARMAESGTFVSYTFQSGGYDSLVDLRKRASHEGLTKQEQARRGALEAYFDKKIEVFAHLMRDGLAPRLLVSTDAGPFDAGFGHMSYGLELAVMAGMTPAQAILAATRIAADACGVSHLVGSIEPGKDADLLVAGGNPLADISNIANVLAVYKGGCLVAPTTTAPIGRTAALAHPSLH